MSARETKKEDARTLVGEQTDDYSPEILCNADDVHVAMVDDVCAHPDVHQATSFAHVQARSAAAGHRPHVRHH